MAVILACVTMGSFLFFMTSDSESWFQAAALLRVSNLSLIILFGIIIYIFVCMVAGVKKNDLLHGSK